MLKSAAGKRCDRAAHFSGRAREAELQSGGHAFRSVGSSGFAVGSAILPYLDLRQLLNGPTAVHSNFRYIAYSTLNVQSMFPKKANMA
jgi:hypothetical protein